MEEVVDGFLRGCSGFRLLRSDGSECDKDGRIYGTAVVQDGAYHLLYYGFGGSG